MLVEFPTEPSLIPRYASSGRARPESRLRVNSLTRPFALASWKVAALKPICKLRSLYEGENVGRHYYDLDKCRLRYFGGTTNHWSGWCRPLSSVDFEAREWIPHSGWPISLDDVTPFYGRAQEFCQLGRYGYDRAFLEIEVPTQPILSFDDGRLVTLAYQLSPPTRFGELYRAELKAANRVSVYLNANVVEIETDAVPRGVRAFRVATLTGARFTVVARRFILAAGGIENARLLLCSNSVMAAGLGNGRDLVGRIFYGPFRADNRSFDDQSGPRTSVG